MSDPTPGPYHIDKTLTDGGAPIIVAENSPYLGRRRLIAKALFDGGSEDPEVHANARLIAAAPDLLAALQDCLAVIMEQIDNETKVCRPGCSSAARAAIAKATEE